MSFNQYRTNPGQAVSKFKGRTDTPKAWPSTAVSTWTNGGLFGASQSFWVMELLQGSYTRRAKYEGAQIAVNPFDGAIYVCGRSAFLTGNQYYGPMLTRLDTDGAVLWSNQSTCTGTVSYFAGSNGLHISFLEGSTDIYVASQIEVGATGSGWWRFSDAGVYLNGSTEKTNGGGACSKVAVGTRYGNTYVANMTAGYSPYGYNSWATFNWLHTDQNAVANSGGYCESLGGHYSSVQQGRDGATLYNNGASDGVVWQLGLDYYNSLATFVNAPIGVGNTNGVTYHISGTNGQGGTLSTKENGNNTYGLVWSVYPNKIGRTNPAVTAPLWSRQVVNNASIQGNYYQGPGVDVNGNIYFAGKADVNSKQSVMVIKFDSSGNVLWDRSIELSSDGAKQSISAHNVASSADGSAIFLNIQSNELNAPQSSTGFTPRLGLMKLNADGSQLGAFTVDNSGGAGGGTSDVFTISAGSRTVNNLTVTFTSGSSTTGSKAGVNPGQPWGNANMDSDIPVLVEIP
jgi:hypothetical protein